MNRHTYDPDYHLLVAEQHHLRPDDEATRTPPVFCREMMRLPLSKVMRSTRRKIRFQEDTTPDRRDLIDLTRQ